MYLNYLGVLKDWLIYFELPNFYLDIYKTDIFKLIFDYIIFFISDAFFKFIIYPQYFLISIILIFNSIIIFLKIINKIEIDLKIFFISVFSVSLSVVSLQVELFRSYTSVIIGIIPLMCFIQKIKNINFKKNCTLVILLPAFFSILFYPMGNNELFKKINFKAKVKKLLMKISNIINGLMNLLIQLIHYLIFQKCVDYLSNLTFNSIYSTIGNMIELDCYLLKKM